MVFYVASLPVGHELLVPFPKTFLQPTNGLGRRLKRVLQVFPVGGCP
jgi:hypothetical protein